MAAKLVDYRPVDSSDPLGESLSENKANRQERKIEVTEREQESESSS